ncbi:HDOD domain-containing protein [Fundidesulfovibrio terrae]|uniref:HDOD domain-containing protein n=1 Tax=Fundidesulfovibrio terrae TaxID=2922866 RepID=UPI001FAFA462|nr:HDOD domain-containing protein [Fundidesulfovibrio terrae]
MWDILAVLLGLTGLALAVKLVMDRRARTRRDKANTPFFQDPHQEDMSLGEVDAGHETMWADYFRGDGGVMVAKRGLDVETEAWREQLSARLELLFSGRPPEERQPELTLDGVRPALLQVLGRRNEILRSFETGYAVLASLGDPNIRLSELSRIITDNPSLSGKVLKCVNSPYFGLRGAVSSIPTAILILGMVNLRNIIYRAHMVQLVDIEDPRLKLFFNQLWEHLTFTSVCCSHVAPAFDGVNPGTLFTMGLLHDIGRFVIATSPLVDRGQDQTLAYDQRFSIEDENELFGINHALAGKLLATRWNFPDRISAGLEHHHSPAWTECQTLGLDSATLRHLTALYVADKLAGVFASGTEEPADPLNISYHHMVDRERLEAAVLSPALARDIKKAQEMALRTARAEE